jgi:hypothetical protein
LVRLGLGNDERAMVGRRICRHAGWREQQRRRDRRRCQQGNINSLHQKFPGVHANKFSRRRKIDWHQIIAVAGQINGAIDGCNKARVESYFNRVLAKFTARSSTLALARWRHFIRLFGLDGILWRHREFGRRASWRNAGRRRRWLWRRRLRHLLRHLCLQCGHDLCCSRRAVGRVVNPAAAAKFRKCDRWRRLLSRLPH